MKNTNVTVLLMLNKSQCLIMCNMHSIKVQNIKLWKLVSEKKCYAKEDTIHTSLTEGNENS